MNEEQLQGQWQQIKGKIQKNWGKLTDSDLNFVNGSSKELVGKIVERYGDAKEKVEDDVKKFLDETD
jgi:uncharacterized protein YjbJ (UPF0337 family)